jgi:solute:Na+ symporter, SSS family
MNWTALVVFVLLFGFMTVLGFVAVHWRRGDLDLLHEWGLAGRRFGTVVTWFLLGGDLYTAYTFVAVPALVFGAGAIGFFAVPYIIMVYPLVFLILPRLWSVAHKQNYITASDFVVAGWAAGLVTGTAMVASSGFQSATYPLGLDGLVVPGYAAIYSLIVNFVVAAVLTVVLNPVAATRGSDQTAPGDYHFEPAPPAESPIPVAATA